MEQLELPTTKRLVSLDALRGFNMVWIIGADDLVSRFLEKFHNPVLTRISDNLTGHVEWEGFHFYDMIFPLFLFILGVALPFSLEKKIQKGDTRKQIGIGILKRTGLLFLLGLINNGLFEFRGLDHLRIAGVLQRLALGYCAAAFILMFTRTRGQIMIAISLLLIYWAMMVWIPVPGVPQGSMTQWGNLANYIDRLIFKPHQMYTPYGDPEGPLSTLPAISTALLGVIAGKWLKSDQLQNRKVAGLFIAGLLCLLLGNLWGLWFPIIKKIWTSSYVLVAGGWSLMLLGLFYWIIDIKGWQRWAFCFIVIGLNPITIYIAQNIPVFDDTASYFFNGLLRLTPYWKPVLFALSVLIIKWLFLFFLHRQKIYIRV